MSNVSIAGYASWPAYDMFFIMLLSGRPVYDPNSLRPNPNQKKPVSGSCCVRRLGRTLIPLPDTMRHILPWRSSRIKGSSAYSTHQIVTMLINFVIRDPSRILLTHWIVTMPIDSIIRDPSCILLTHWIATMPINFIIRDPSRDHANRLLHQGFVTHPPRIIPMPINSVIRDPARDVTHPPDPSVWKTNGPGPPFPWR